MRPTKATISAAALAHNYAFAKHCAAGAQAYAVIKANGYGHGVMRVANALKGADGFAVIELDVAVRLREAGFMQPIMLLPGLFEPNEFEVFAANQLDMVVHNDAQIVWLELAQKSFVASAKINVFLKFNSGMNRLGFMPEEAQVVYERLSKLTFINEIIFTTHFARADEPTFDMREPLRRMATAEAGLKRAGFGASLNAPNKRQSFCNSAATIDHTIAHGDIVRPGIMLYGATPFAHKTAAQIGLKPAMEFTSQVVAIQSITAGETVGYGGRFTATRTDKPTRIAVIACGYADGYPRHAPIGTPISVAGVRTVTAGRVAMDTMFADVTDIPQAQLGSSVELWGNHVSVDEVAILAGTIGYELLCAITQRVHMVDVE